MNKCDICQLEVHGVEVCPLCYQLVPGRLVGSKKSSVTLSDAVSTNVGCFAKRFERIHSPRRDESGFLLFVHRKYILLFKRYLFYRDNHSIHCNSSVKKLKLEGLKFGFFRAIKRQYMNYPILWSFRNFRSQLSIYSGYCHWGDEVIPLTINLYASLQKLEDDSNFWLPVSWSSELIVGWSWNLPWRRLHHNTLKRWCLLCSEF